MLFTQTRKGSIKMKITEGEFDEIVASAMEQAKKGIFNSAGNIDGFIVRPPDYKELTLIPIQTGIFMEALSVSLLRGLDFPVKIKGEIKIVPEISEVVPVIVFKADTHESGKEV